MIAVIRSQDQGLTWSQPIIVNTLQSIGVTDLKTAKSLRTGDIIPDIAADQNTGTLYAAWQDARFSGGMRDGIALSKSTDGGLTWSAAVQVNKAPNVQAFTASVDVADDGTVGVTYYDFRRDTKIPTCCSPTMGDHLGRRWRDLARSPTREPASTCAAPQARAGIFRRRLRGSRPRR